MQLNLTRPLLFFDIESTGLNIPEDAIVELSFVKVFPGGEEDDMLTGCPTFFELAEEVASWVADSDLAGFNSAKFDLPMLAEEFERVKLAGKDLHVDLHSPLMVDVQNIFHTMEPRNLRAAYRFYCGGEDFENAHSAEADTLATYEVLKAQLDRYQEPDKYREQVLKNDVNALAAFVGKKYVDFSGHLILDDKGEVLINFGKHKGKTARKVWETEPSYFAWIQQGTFTLDTKAQFAKLEEQFKRERLAAKWNGKLF